LGLGIISQFEKNGVWNAYLWKLWDHSMSVGALATKLAQDENPMAAIDAFTAGLLHDIGEVVLAINLPDQFVAAQKLVENEKISRSESERRVFGTTHAEVGAYLLCLWGLPTQVVEAVAYHHTPNDSHINSFTALTAVHIANAFQHSVKAENSTTSIPYIDFEYITKLGLSEKIPQWQDEIALSVTN